MLLNDATLMIPSSPGPEMRNGSELENSWMTLRQATDDDGAEDGAVDGAQTADDDDGDELDGQDQAELAAELGRADELLDGRAVERAGHRGHGARHGEGAELVAQQADADDLGRDVAVADGLHGPTRAASARCSWR